MSQFNPYASPAAEAEPVGRAVVDEDAVNSSEVIEVLKQTRSWVQMIGVLGYLGAGTLGAFGLAAMAFGGWRRFSGFSGWAGVLYVAIAVMYVFPCMALLRYGRSIGDLQNGQGVPALVDALRHQKSFWRYAGVLTILFMVVSTYAFSVIGNVLGAKL
jgi:hypothetical protein